jgi:holo-[acyl-carrier protein] synthase
VIVAVGIDTVDVARIARLAGLDGPDGAGGAPAARGERFLRRVFTGGELSYCLGRANAAESLAARFAAKEAAMKCLGTGWGDGVGFLQVEVVRAPSGAVALRLHGEALARAEALAIRRLHVSLTHTAAVASAFVVAEA